MFFEKEDELNNNYDELDQLKIENDSLMAKLQDSVNEVQLLKADVKYLIDFIKKNGLELFPPDPNSLEAFKKMTPEEKIARNKEITERQKDLIQMESKDKLPMATMKEQRERAEKQSAEAVGYFKKTLDMIATCVDTKKE